MIIRDIYLRKITDSRGNPTVEADIITNDGFGRAAAPAGASTGTFEAQAWPKNDVNLGIRNAKKNLIPALIGITTNDQNTFDNTIKEKDGTKNLQNVGGNIAVALSLACLFPETEKCDWSTRCKSQSGRQLQLDISSISN